MNNNKDGFGIFKLLIWLFVISFIIICFKWIMDVSGIWLAAKMISYIKGW